MFVYIQIAVTSFSDDALFTIFNTIVNWHLTKEPAFDSKIVNLAKPLVEATVALYNMASSKLLPTPKKSHYTFNLRDLAKVIQGVCLSRSDNYFAPDKFVRLWVHEGFRVFGDRLIDDSDVSSFLSWVTEIAEDKFKIKFDEVCKRLDSNGDGKVNTPDEIRSLMFGFYMDPKGEAYDEVTDLKEMRDRWQGFLDEYNQVNKTPMNIVLFQFALEHASRLSRVLKQRGGNALLVGVGGSGKQSLTRISAYVCGFDVESIELVCSSSKRKHHK